MRPTDGRRGEPLGDVQRAGWLEAQRLWGVQMHEPRQFPDAGVGSFAWFSFPPAIGVDPVLAVRHDADREWASVFAHEIGHHVLSPSTPTTALKLRQQIARAVVVAAPSIRPGPGLAVVAAQLSNLWSDLLINVAVAERQRVGAGSGEDSGEPGMVRLWRSLGRVPSTDPWWWVVRRSYEELWGLPAGTLCSERPPAGPDPAVTGRTDPAVDATLVARTVRTFGTDPVRGALRFAMIAAAYLPDPAEPTPAGGRARAGGDPAGCAGEQGEHHPTAAELEAVLRDPRLREEPRHPALEATAEPDGATSPASGSDGAGDGQGYGLSDTITVLSPQHPQTVMEAWYLAAAARHVRPYRQRVETGDAGEEVPGPLVPWALGDDLSDLDWPGTLTTSPVVLPGLTTRRRESTAEHGRASVEPLDLDLYIDSSGSMTRPRDDSPAVLAGTILIASVLSGGGQVRVTSFSGPGQVSGTTGFTRQRGPALQALLSYHGGGTTFPLDLLAARARDRRPGRRHLVVLSDDGLASFFGAGQPQHAGVAADVRRGLSTGTLLVVDRARRIADLAAAGGYDVEYLDTVADAPAACARLAERLLATRAPAPGGRRG